MCSSDLRNFMANDYAPLVASSKAFRLGGAIIFLSLVLTAIAALLTKGLEVGMPDRYFVRDDSYVNDFFDSLHESFSNRALVEMGLVLPTPHFGVGAYHVGLRELLGALGSSSGVAKVECWLSKLATSLPDKATPAEANATLAAFLGSPAGKMFARDVVHSKTGNDLAAARCRIFVWQPVDVALRSRQGQRLTAIADRASVPAILYHASLPVHVGRYEEIQGLIFQTMGYACFAVFSALLLFLPPHLALLAVTNVASVVVVLLGFMVLAGISCNAISYIVCVMAIGFCVDYSCHIMHFANHDPAARTAWGERMMHSLKSCGYDIFHGCVTAFLGVVLLSLGQSPAFRMFSIMSMVITGTGGLLALWGMPALLAFIPPCCRVVPANGSRVVPANGPELVNWMGNARTSPQIFVEADTVQDVQRVVRDSAHYPSPVRAVGALLSPSACHSNDGGTTIGMGKLTHISGLHHMKSPMVGPQQEIQCVEAQAGVTLSQLQRFLHGWGLEMAFSAEIGSATLGGVCFATTKDSALGPVCPSGGIGDFQSCLMALTVVDGDGELTEHHLYKDDGSKDLAFQSLLSSEGTQGIAVSMLVAVRHARPIVTTLHVLRAGPVNHMCEHIKDMHASAARAEGNVFALISLRSGYVLVEHRALQDLDSKTWAPLSGLVRTLYEPLKKWCFQRSATPAFVGLLRCLSGSCFLRYTSNPRRPGFEYPQRAQIQGRRRLTFSYYSFPLSSYDDVVRGGVEWIRSHKHETGFTPDAIRSEEHTSELQSP